jgi:hypothetical protein
VRKIESMREEGKEGKREKWLGDSAEAAAEMVLLWNTRIFSTI